VCTTVTSTIQWCWWGCLAGIIVVPSLALESIVCEHLSRLSVMLGNGAAINCSFSQLEFNGLMGQAWRSTNLVLLASHSGLQAQTIVTGPYIPH